MWIELTTSDWQKICLPKDSKIDAIEQSDGKKWGGASCRCILKLAEPSQLGWIYLSTPYEEVKRLFGITTSKPE